MQFSPRDEQPLKEYPTIESTPEMVGIRCKVLAYTVFFALALLPFLVSLYVWFAYDWLIAIGTGLFLYLLSAVVSSKLRLQSLPFDQRERSFSSYEIAKWYVSKHYCY